MKTTVILSAILIAASCCRGNAPVSVFDTVCYEPEYARGFEIVGIRDSSSRVLRVLSAWQDEDFQAKELFISRNGECPPDGFKGQVLDGNAIRIAAMSSSHIAMLDLLGEISRVKAVSGIRFISNDYVREHRVSIADVGSEADADFEKLAAAQPDLVLLYGIDSASPMEKRLESLGIPFVYIGEYVEQHPLGRAEWVVALGEIIGCRERGEAVFSGIAHRYNELKDRIPEDVSRPEVMLNTPYGDTWFVPSPNSAMVRLLRDAGAEYVYRPGRASGAKSLAVDMEEASLMVSEADFWLNVGPFRSLGQLVSSYPEFSGMRCVADGNVYSCDRRKTDGGGSDFWESGAVRPDVVLNDLVRIFHPELSETDGSGASSLVYYRRLEP